MKTKALPQNVPRANHSHKAWHLRNYCVIKLGDVLLLQKVSETLIAV